jgi:hypothetical protein
VQDGFDVDTPDADDFASMLADLQNRLDRATLARAIGVKPSELDLIAAGYAPEPEAAERLRLLHGLSGQTEDLRDPQGLLEGMGLVPKGGRVPLELALLSRFKPYIVAFLVLDAIVFGAFVLVFVLVR